ncbi:MAG: hypothetical protein WDM81_08455 [Rhizomicrobium sp.]
MRTTLTLDEDNARRLTRLRKARDASLKAVVNDVIRRGLDEAEKPPRPREPFRTKAADAGGVPVSVGQRGIAGARRRI